MPSTSAKNLTRLVTVLQEIDGRPLGPFGSRTTLSNGELKWIARETTPEEVAAWQPDPNDAGTMDHLYPTRYGSFDVVPELMGSYDFLMARAVQIPVLGFRPRVTPIDDLLSRNTVPRREKDSPRVRALRKIQRERAISNG